MGLFKAEDLCRCCLWAPIGMARRDAARLWAVLCGCCVFPWSLWEAQAVLSFPPSSSLGCHRCCQHRSHLCLSPPCVSTAAWHVPRWFGQECLEPVFLLSPLLILLWSGSVCHSTPSRRLLRKWTAEEWVHTFVRISLQHAVEGLALHLQRKDCCEWEAFCSYSCWYNHSLVNPTALEGSPPECR